MEAPNPRQAARGGRQSWLSEALGHRREVHHQRSLGLCAVDGEARRLFSSASRRGGDGSRVQCGHAASGPESSSRGGCGCGASRCRDRPGGRLALGSGPEAPGTPDPTPRPRHRRHGHDPSRHVRRDGETRIPRILIRVLGSRRLRRHRPWPSRPCVCAVASQSHGEQEHGDPDRRGVDRSGLVAGRRRCRARRRRTTPSLLVAWRSRGPWLRRPMPD